MPSFSIFQDFAAFEFSGKPSKGEAIYNSAKAAVDKAFRLVPGTYEEARIYAMSMGLARAAYALDRARNQLLAFRSIELLPELEYDWSLIPGPYDGIVTRQLAVALRMKLPRGAVRENIEAILRDIYGDDFLTLRVLEPTEVTIWPFNPWDGPGVWSREDVTVLPKFFKLTVAISPGIRTVYYAPLQDNDPLSLYVGEKVTVEVENLDFAEQVLVTAVGEDSFGKYFTGIFLKSHGVDATVTSGTVPIWMSNQRFEFFIIDEDSATDREKYLLVADVMNKVMRSVTQWEVVQPTTPGATTVGPFTLNVTPLGTSTIGQIPFVGTEGGVPPDLSPYPPFISFLDVTSGPIAGGTAVSVYGQNFSGLTALNLLSDTPPTILLVTNNRIDLLTGATAVDTGFLDVQVVTPGGTDTLTNAFEYISPPLFEAPGVSPISGPYIGGTVVEISGLNFYNITEVDFGGDKAVILWYTSSKIQVLTPYSSIADDIVDVTVIGQYGTCTVTGAYEFLAI